MIFVYMVYDVWQSIIYNSTLCAWVVYIYWIVVYMVLDVWKSMIDDFTLCAWVGEI